MSDQSALLPPTALVKKERLPDPEIGYLVEKETKIRWLAKDRSLASARVDSTTVDFVIERSGVARFLLIFHGEAFFQSCPLPPKVAIPGEMFRLMLG